MNRRHSLPAELYALVEHTPATILVECAGRGAAEREGECWTRLFTAPVRECVANELADIPRLFAEIESAVAQGLCAAGFFTYECGGFFEPRTAIRSGSASDRPAQPLAWFGIYERDYPFDHRTGAFVGGDPPGLAEFRSNAPGGGPGEQDSKTDSILEAVLDLTEREYAERIAAIHEWIRAGDVYQLNFTVPFRVHARGSAAALYRRLSLRQPVPYGAFLHWQKNRRILSFSPELFFRLESDGGVQRLTARPMKGTVARGRTTREDRALAQWLRNDPKNRSENVMIVDLLRNDLGRLCRYGSVQTENMFSTERFPTLWQMTSTVTGELRAEAGFIEIFRALFPCGSVTGAPKVRAMELLANLEEEPRGVYTGAIGFFSKEQSIFNVAIRTLELNGEHGKMGVGSGIVIDSDAAGEFGECLLKAEFLTRPAHVESERFSLVETLLWNGAYRLIELHLDRLEDSAGYFDYSCDRGAVKGALLGCADGFEDHAPRKVRLLLDWNGAVQITAEALPESREQVRVRVSSLRTDPRDRMLFHKTTHRRLYAEAFEAATRAGLDDVLFLNLRGEVTEGAIHNVFVVKGGRWATPPVECGLLAGVMRRHLMETQGGVEERVLSMEDLRAADAVYLSNAVRGVRLAEIEWEDD
jgi:para-aminobenzoate synthetase/4-amino-4-deoxychorismate lyase